MTKNSIKEKNNIIENAIVGLANGDVDAMDILYSTIKTDVYAFALSKVYNKNDADDILQDTFVRIYENAKLYVPLGKPMAWVFTVELNIINRYFQLKSRYDVLNDETIIHDIVDESNDSKNNEIQDEYLIMLLESLDEFEREVISLHLVSDLKFREIAEMLNKPLSTILSKYNRAIKKMRKISKGGKLNEKK
ncbi:MAG: RNA polymerase sigma factor [Erysipelotrichaceae bacterium]|nr:RNA polymerase sigma factor [Erysipelotrichaceae bacterium]